MDAEVSAQLLLFAEQTTDFVGVAGPWGEILYLNAAARKRLGVADATELTIADVFPADEFDFYYSVVRPQLLGNGAWSGVVRVNVGGGEAVKMYVSTTATVGPGGTIEGLVVHARDVADTRGEAIVGGSEIDDATGLLTRSAFAERVRRSLRTAPRDGETRALVLVEVVGTVEGIEMSGHLAAPTIMRSLGGRLKLVARTIDIAGRIDDDQLGLLLGAVRGYGEASRIAQVVQAALVDPPITTAGGTVTALVRCAAAVSKPHDDPVALIERARAALSDDPTFPGAAGPALGDDAAKAASIDDFRVGLGRREVQPYVEPVVELRSGRVVAYRGSARWQHRTLGVLEPSAFIELVADTALASHVDLYVARETAAVLTLAAGGAPLRMYTPVSRRLVADVHTEQYLSEIADAYVLSMGQVRLEIARSLLDRWTSALDDAAESLRDAGVGLVLTGVENFADARSLATHPFDELLISRRLIADAPTDSDARDIVFDIAELARGRGVTVGARGVDTEGHRDLVIAAGCDYASGARYGPPTSADTID